MLDWYRNCVSREKATEVLCESLMSICLFSQIGLVEKEWLDTLAAIDPGHVTYTDYVDCGRLLARNLKEVHGCRLIIALTHMRTPNDERLAKEVEEIDLILGGHDHVAEFIQVRI